jgi:hypothetical protein
MAGLEARSTGEMLPGENEHDNFFKKKTPLSMVV